MASHLSFSLRRDQLADRILIPKYYDPEIAESIGKLDASRYHVRALQDLLEPGDLGSRLGVWVPREHYGTGSIPYVRTSDLSEWRIRPDVKKGVSEDVYAQTAARVDVRPGDILMVAHGTYLVGSVAIVERGEERLVLQDHVFRLRVKQGTDVDPYLLLALLSTGFVRRQVRCKQFSADIIDKIGNRHLDLLLAVPKDPAERAEISRRVRGVISRQSAARAQMRASISSDLRMTRERAGARHGFSVMRRSIESRILIPKFYDPDLEKDLAAAERTSARSWVKVSELAASQALDVSTGVEVGKMAYGTGDIPFVRTSDIAEWGVKRDVRQGISEEIYNSESSKARIAPGDVLLVRDGTYLVGSSAIVGEDDVPGLICGGLYRLRSRVNGSLTPEMLLGLLNLPIVRRQMRARQFTRDVIDTLGKRLMEVRLPHPEDPFSVSLGASIASVMNERHLIKAEVGAIIDAVEPSAPPALRGRPGWSMR